MALCRNNFRNSPGVAFYRIPKVRRFQREYQQNMYVFFGTLIWSCFTVHSSRFFQGKITPGTSAVAVLSPLKHSTSLSAMFVYIRVPLNNPISARAPSFGPRLSLFSEVSYWGWFSVANVRHFLNGLRVRDWVRVRVCKPSSRLPDVSLAALLLSACHSSLRIQSSLLSPRN